MKPAIHSLSVVESFADESQVLHDDNRRVEPLCVFDDFAGCFLNNDCEHILVVLETFIDVPFRSVAFL